MVDFMISVCYNEEKTEGGYDMCKMVPFEGDKQVADIKLHHIRNIVDQASAAKNINRIMLFGSATEERCSDRSDIDIAVFGNMTKSSYLKSKEFKAFQDAIFRFDFAQDYDILYFSDRQPHSDPILNDIFTGTEIYRRSTL